MCLKDITLNKEDLEKIPWKSVLEDCDHRECDDYSPLFHARARESEESGDERAAALFSLFHALTMLTLNPDSKTDPFDITCKAIIDGFDDKHLLFLREIVSEISDPELRARIADVLWVRNRDHEMARLAIESYLDSASALENPKEWVPCAYRIERAFRLAVSLGKNAGNVGKIIEYIETVLDRLNGEDPLFLSEKMMGLLLEARQGSSSKYSKISEKLARRAEQDKSWHRARTYWSTNARWHALDGNEEAERTALTLAAETYVQEANTAIEGEGASYFKATHHLQCAIVAFRRVGGMKQRVDELQEALLEYQEKSIDEMDTVSTDIDLGDQIEKTISSVKGKDLQDAIFELALRMKSPRKGALREQVEKTTGEFIFHHLFPEVAVNEKGKVIGRMPNLLADDPDKVETAIRAKMFKHAELHHLIRTNAVIEPIRYQINLEHNVRLADFVPIVFDNPLIPKGREHIYAEGLHSGIKGDYLVATHLLIPQFENSVRHVLSQYGFITSGFDSAGIQDEYNLSKTLYMDEAKEIFGEDILFDLQGLLVERFGANLRNRMAHGLMSADQFYSAPGAYFWALILRLCCLPIIGAIRKKDQSDVKNVETDDGTNVP